MLRQQLENEEAETQTYCRVPVPSPVAIETQTEEQTETQATTTQAETKTANSLLARLKKHTRLQKASLWAGGLIGGTTSFLLATSMFFRMFPLLYPYSGFLSPFVSFRTYPSNMNGPLMHLTVMQQDFLSPILLLLGSGLLLALARAQREQATLALEEYTDLSAVGPLAEALQSKNRLEAASAATALASLLPRLQPTDAHLLNATQRACLHRALNSKNTELSLAILLALEQIGDSRDLPVVWWLARNKAAAGNRAIQDAAQACLPALQRRAAEEREQWGDHPGDSSTTCSASPNESVMPAPPTPVTMVTPDMG